MVVVIVKAFLFVGIETSGTRQWSLSVFCGRFVGAVAIFARLLEAKKTAWDPERNVQLCFDAAEDL